MGTLREDMEAASVSLEGSDDTGTSESVAASADTGVPLEAAPGESVATPPEGGETSGAETPPATDGRARDAAGKFARAEAATAKAPKEVAGALPTAQTAPPLLGGDPSKTEAPRPGEANLARPPSSWRASALADWEKTPPAARAEAHRLHSEMSRFMEESAPARRLMGELRETLAPILPALQQRGTTPQKLIADYVNFDRAMSSQDPGAKAQAVAQVVKAYGVDIEALASALDAPQQRQAPVDPGQMRAQIMTELRQELAQERSRAELSSHQKQVQEFAGSKDADLFNDDIRFQMAALIDASAARNVTLSLKDAYSQAVWANPETRAIIQQRESAKSQATAQAATQRTMAAGSSIKSRPASPAGSGESGRSLREDLEASAANLSGR